MTSCWRLAVLAVAGLAGLAGCAATGSGGSAMAGIAEAKAELLALQGELVEQLPEALLLELHPVAVDANGLAAGCAGPGTYRWPGAWSARIDPTTEVRPILLGLAATWGGRSGWRAEWAEPGGAPLLRLRREDGLWLSIGTIRAGGVLQINSLSACFALADHDPLRRR